MTYRIHHIDVEAPLPSLAVEDCDTGFALILRYRGRIVGFVMRAAAPGTRIAQAELERLIVDETGPLLLQEDLRPHVSPRSETTRRPSITAAVCTKDRPDMLRRCLDSLTALAEWTGREPAFRILVVDNAPSDDATQLAVGMFPGVEYAREPRPGLDFARNRAIRRCETELIAYVDDDAVVDGGWLAGLREAWAANPDAGAFTGLVLPLALETEAQILFERRGGFRRGFQVIRFGRGHPVHWTYPCGAGSFGAGCNMAFRRDVLLALGGFDEALDTGPPLPGGGDLDIFFRVVRAGHPLVYEPQFAVYHEHRRDMARLRHQYWTWGLGFTAYVTKSIRSDPELRGRFRRLVVQWGRGKWRELWRTLTGRDPTPPSFVAAELLGAVAGAFGVYDRSLRRTERIRRRHP